MLYHATIMHNSNANEMTIPIANETIESVQWNHKKGNMYRFET